MIGPKSTTFKDNIFSNFLTTHYFDSSIVVALNVTLVKNKIYHKMQREKLYNLQTKVYFNCILFVFKKKQNAVRPIFAVAKTDRTEFGVFLNIKSIQLK